MSVQIKNAFFLPDATFINIIIAEVETVMEQELSKTVDKMNTKVIDDCVSTIEFLNQILDNHVSDEMVCCDADLIIKHFSKRRKYFVSSAIACAAIVLLCIGSVNTMSHEKVNYGFIDKRMLSGIFNVLKKETKKENVTEVLIETTKIFNNTETTYNVTTTLPLDMLPEKTTQKALAELTSINVILPDNMRTQYEKIEELDFSELVVELTYSDYEKKEISINECVTNIGVPDENGKVCVEVVYENKSVEFYVIVQSEQEKNPVTLNSIYGRFTEGYSVEFMEVVAVYSDSSEKIIPKESCNIVTEYSEDFGANIVTVEYNGCSFSFMPQ